MKAAIVHAAGETPVYGEFKFPTPGEDEVVVSVAAAAVTPLARARAAGRHYSASSGFPFVPGIDGVGRLADGSRVYFAFPSPPYGGLAEQTVVNRRQCTPLPEGLEDVAAAACANPGMSSWAALRERARLAAGEGVLINGATGAAGQMAIQIAKHLGAGRVVATGLDAQILPRLRELGADAVVALGQPAERIEADLRRQLPGIDIVVDYLWGPSAELILRAVSGTGEDARRIRFVQVGSVSADSITLPAAALRSSGVELLGSGIGSVPRERMGVVLAELMGAIIPARLRVDTAVFRLSEIEAAWTRDLGGRRAVFIPS